MCKAQTKPEQNKHKGNAHESPLLVRDHRSDGAPRGASSPVGVQVHSRVPFLPVPPREAGEFEGVRAPGRRRASPGLASRPAERVFGPGRNFAVSLGRPLRVSRTLPRTPPAHAAHRENAKFTETWRALAPSFEIRKRKKRWAFSRAAFSRGPAARPPNRLIAAARRPRAPLPEILRKRKRYRSLRSM